jgi:hypothetical protein
LNLRGDPVHLEANAKRSRADYAAAANSLVA